MITLELTPTEEEQIAAIAGQIGLAPSEYVKKLVQEHLPPVQDETRQPISAKNAAAIALLGSWIAEDAAKSPEEKRQADADLQELLYNLNKNRIDSGERPLFPDAPHTS